MLVDLKTFEANSPQKLSWIGELAANINGERKVQDSGCGGSLVIRSHIYLSICPENPVGESSRIVAF